MNISGSELPEYIVLTVFLSACESSRYSQTNELSDGKYRRFARRRYKRLTHSKRDERDKIMDFSMVIFPIGDLSICIISSSR